MPYKSPTVRPAVWLAFAALAPAALAQTITTVAGITWSFPATPLAAVQAPLGQVVSVASDPSGNYYLDDIGNSW